jgi:hypothetical protein
MALKPNELLKERYRITEILGEGGMGAVYRAEDINLGVTVAVKENLFITEEYARQFRREATILASLRHPHLPRVTDHFVIEDQGQYLVMDYVEGQDLRERIEQGGPIAERRALPWFLEICDALSYLHSRVPPIVHRDIKPGNIKITPEGRAVLVDFGLAKVAEAHARTTSGAKAMTPGFSPPEQYGTGPTDARTDVYSLAATLYAALTGRIPEDALERAMGREVLTPIQDSIPAISDDLARTIEKALIIRPDERYQSIAELADALGGVPAASEETVIRSVPYGGATMGTPAQGQENALRSQVEPLTERRKAWPIALFVLVVLGVALSGVLLAVPDLGPHLTAFLAMPTTEVPVEGGLTQPPSNSTSTPTPEAGQDEPTGSAMGTESVIAVFPTPTRTITAEPTPAATPVGGGRGEIAFVSNRSGLPQIYLINVDGTGLRQLTDLPDGACQPTWSPSGEHLLFTSPCRKNQALYPNSTLVRMSLAAMEPEFLPSIPGGGDFDPAWSPSGSRIAFTSLRKGRPQIYLMSFESEEAVQVSMGNARDSQPEWDPLGTLLLFTTLRADNTEIWYMPDGGEDVQRFSLPSGRDDSHADWSHNGQLVLFEREIGGIPRLMVKPFEDRDVPAKLLCPEGPHASQPMAEPRWSPDSRWVLFETWPDGVNHNIAFLSANCTSYSELTSDPAADFDAVWRP